MPSIEWLTPAPLWAPQSNTLQEPRLVKLAGDNFLPDFLEAMGGAVAGTTPQAFLADPAHAFVAAEDKIDGKLKLFHPAHGRYYLVTGSLVCRQVGLPDRTIARADGEGAFFVIRRAVTVGGVKQEQGWVDEGPQRGWQPLVDGRGRTVAARADEEYLPLHPVPVGAARVVATVNGSNGANGAGLGCCDRTLHYGYIPVGNREKYLARRAVDTSQPEDALNAYEAEVRSASAKDGGYDFRLDEFATRVADPWLGILTAKFPVDKLDPALTDKGPEFSLYLLVDLADWIQRNTPDVFAAIAQGAALPAGSGRAQLLTELERLKIKVTRPGGAKPTISLRTAIFELRNRLSLVNGVGDEPADQYDVRSAGHDDGFDLEDYLAPESPVLPGPPAGFARFRKRARAALAESTPQPPAQEVLDLLADQVVIDRSTDDAGPDENSYFVRFVDVRPGCPPVVGARSKTFVLAKFFDPDAPARHIRLELPSIKMKDLRKYKRGVGMEMSPELRDVMNRVTKGMLDGDGLSGSSGGWELGMICSFSLQIIFLVAFIVMFIFLIAFNFIFWWMAFLKICFPIPVKK